MAENEHDEIKPFEPPVTDPPAGHVKVRILEHLKNEEELLYHLYIGRITETWPSYGSPSGHPHHCRYQPKQVVQFYYPYMDDFKDAFPVGATLTIRDRTIMRTLEFYLPPGKVHESDSPDEVDRLRQELDECHQVIAKLSILPSAIAVARTVELAYCEKCAVDYPKVLPFCPICGKRQ